MLAAASVLPLASATSLAGPRFSGKPQLQTAPPIQVPPKYTLNIEQHAINPLGTTPADRYPAILPNGTLPGTELRFREGDQFRVLVNNRLMEPTTVHWHGMLVPNLQDGVPKITQAPITPGNSIFYEYPIRQSGTYWYHSHVGLQEQQGLAGPLIIDPLVERHAVDRDYVVFLQSWLNTSPYAMVPEIRNGAVRPGLPPNAPWNPLQLNQLNSKSWLVDVYPAGLLMNGLPASRGPDFVARPGERIRLRIINASTSSYFRVELAGHPLNVIAADSQPVVPVAVDNLVFGPGERYDVLVDVKGEGAWQLRAAGMGLPSSAIGTLRTPAGPSKAMPVAKFGPRLLSYADLRSPYETTLPEGPLKTFTLDLAGNMKDYLWSMGGQYFAEPYVPNPDATLLEIESGDRVRVIMPNTSKMAHPMHLHGHFFRLVTQGSNWKTPNLPMKDTVSVYPGETTQFEFTADNPGNWFFHCHNLYHLASGMAREFRYTV
jgi:FtsP/CotA-like multicopper oxidase with cupredoxin domain